MLNPRLIISVYNPDPDSAHTAILFRSHKNCHFASEFRSSKHEAYIEKGYS